MSVSTTLFLKAGPRNASHRLRPRRADTPLVNVSEDLVGNGIPKVRRHRASQIAPGLPAARSGTPLNQAALKLPVRPQVFFAALISSTPKCWNVGSVFGPNTFSTEDGYVLRCGGQARRPVC